VCLCLTTLLTQVCPSVNRSTRHRVAARYKARMDLKSYTTSTQLHASNTLENLMVAKIIMKFSSFLWNPEVLYRVHKRPPLDPLLCQLNLVHTFALILILSSHLHESPKCPSLDPILCQFNPAHTFTLILILSSHLHESPKRPPLHPILCQLNQVHAFTLILIISCHLHNSPKWSLPLRFSSMNF
jgi:hypothetical protein